MMLFEAKKRGFKKVRNSSGRAGPPRSHLKAYDGWTITFVLSGIHNVRRPQDHRMKGPQDQRTTDPEDHKGKRDQGTRGPCNHWIYENKRTQTTPGHTHTFEKNMVPVCLGPCTPLLNPEPSSPNRVLHLQPHAQTLNLQPNACRPCKAQVHVGRLLLGVRASCSFGPPPGA